MKFIRRKDRGESKNRVPPGSGLRMNGAGQYPEVEPELDKVLRDFRVSAHAWSEAVYSTPRQMEMAPRRIAWRWAVAWVLGSVLVAGGAGGGILGYQHHQEQARIAAAREAQRQLEVREERARAAEQELAKVDRAISRQVPDAFEPLAELMTSGETQ